MRQILRLVSVIVVSLLASVSANLDADERAEVSAVVESIGQQVVETEHAVGLSIGVARGETILCAKGFGLANVELNVPATADTVYRIGSITKQFTAAAILLLIEDDKIQLDDPLTKFIPDYPMLAKAVTIRHLLAHTSGIKDFTRLPAYRNELPLHVSQADVLNRFQALPLDFEPGAKHSYCNSGYFLLGVVIEKASGKSFQEFVEERLFKSLALQHTYCDAHDRLIPQRAAGYARWWGELRNAPYINLKQTIGAGNLASTVGDLIAWQRALVTHRLLTAESSRLMTTQGKLTDGQTFNYGLGVFIGKLGDHELIRHGGGIQGFRADLAYYPATGYTIVVLANTGNTNAARISDRLARRLLAAGAAAEETPPKTSK